MSADDCNSSDLFLCADVCVCVCTVCVCIGASELARACLSEWVLSDMRPARSACRNLPAAEDPCITVLRRLRRRRPYTKLMTTGYVGQGRRARRDLGGQWTAGGRRW